MEPWSARDDSRYVSYEASSSFWWIWVLVAALLGAGALYYFWPPPAEPAPPPLSAPELPAVPAPPPSAAEPAVRYPVPAAQEKPAKPLPTLEKSDALMRDTVSGLVGRKAFEALVQPTQLIRRIVATVDNLPRETAPARMLPLEPVPGRFTPNPNNAARYTPYVRVLESLDARTLVQRYFASYPLFQRAYVELGYPKRNFNDRLVEAVDDLLAAPEMPEPPELVRPKVPYEFADPQLEERSAGQKIMLRIGAANAARVKAKLREIRGELVQRTPAGS